MKYHFDSFKLLEKSFSNPDKGDFEIRHALENEMVIDVKGNLQYLLVHKLDVVDKKSTVNVLALHVAYLYVVSELSDINAEMFREIIFNSLERFSDHYYSLVKVHFFEESEIPLKDQSDQFVKTATDYLSSHLN